MVVPRLVAAGGSSERSIRPHPGSLPLEALERAILDRSGHSWGPCLEAGPVRLFEGREVIKMPAVQPRAFERLLTNLVA